MTTMAGDPIVVAQELAKRDPVIAALVDEFGPPEFPEPTEQPFATLVRAITQQQIATAAARAIHARLITALGGQVTAERLAATPSEELRAAGLSANKVASLKDLATKTLEGSVHLAPGELAQLPDDEITAELTSVRGIGTWTADMFLMFQLRRPDVWPVGDLALRRGIADAWQIPSPTPKQLVAFGEQFRPHRSVVAWYGYQAAHRVNTSRRDNEPWHS
jgi:DNA-3-methyladenine glycosylase II